MNFKNWNVTYLRVVVARGQTRLKYGVVSVVRHDLLDQHGRHLLHLCVLEGCGHQGCFTKLRLVTGLAN